jgi:tRNA-dependent cyclodipeptide synthase
MGQAVSRASTISTASSFRFKSAHVLCGVSVAPASPLLQPYAALSLMTFLSAQPKPAVVLLADELNRFNAAADGVRAEAAQLSHAAHAAQPLWKSLSHAHGLLPAAFQKHVSLLRWHDVAVTSNYAAVQRACARMYAAPGAFRCFGRKVDAVAEAFVSERWKDAATSRPRRLAASVQYILHELPVMLCGVNHLGRHYSLLAYPGKLQRELCALLHAVHHEPDFITVRTELQKTGALWAAPGIVALSLP